MHSNITQTINIACYSIFTILTNNQLSFILGFSIWVITSQQYTSIIIFVKHKALTAKESILAYIRPFQGTSLHSIQRINMSNK